MLDNRHLLPLGTIAFQQDGKLRLCVAGKNGDNAMRVLPATAMKLGWKRMISIPDIVVSDGENCVVDNTLYLKDQPKIMTTNHETNTGAAKQLPMPQSDIVIIAAPGRIPEKDHRIIAAGSSPIITIGSAGKLFEKPDYCVVADYHEIVLKHFEGIDLSCTTGVLSTAVFPGVAKLPWKDVTWYTTLPRRLDGMPYCFTSEGVITDAVCFAVKQLGAKQVILVGVEQPATSRVYFWEGIILQAHCFFYARHGIKIWNCTPATSVLAGVILGSLEEACQSPSQLRQLS